MSEWILVGAVAGYGDRSTPASDTRTRAGTPRDARPSAGANPPGHRRFISPLLLALTVLLASCGGGGGGGGGGGQQNRESDFSSEEYRANTANDTIPNFDPAARGLTETQPGSEYEMDRGTRAYTSDDGGTIACLERGGEDCRFQILEGVPPAAAGELSVFFQPAQVGEARVVAGVVSVFSQPTEVMSLSASPSTISEEGGLSTVRIVLNHAVPPDTHGTGDNLVFPYTITGIQAADIMDADADDDGNSLTGNITVRPDSSSGAFTIRTMQDIEDEGSGETMTITLGTLPKNDAEVRIINRATPPITDITITDDDDFTSQITFVPPLASGSISEGNDDATSTNGIEVVVQSFNNARVEAVTFDCVFVLGGTATFGTDYIFRDGGTDIRPADITFTGGTTTSGTFTETDCGPNVGSTTVTSRLKIIDDPLDEQNETITLRLVSVTARDSGGTSLGTASIVSPDTLTLTINDDDLVPSFSGGQAALNWTQNMAITAVILPAASGGDGTLIYALTPALPNGVTFNAASRQLSGTPTASAAQTQYTLTASDDDGDTDTLLFNITVAADLTPSFSGTQAALSWMQNTAITAVTLPVATGGDGTLTYSLTPNLPRGVTFNAASRQLSGTPTVSAAQRLYTLTARDTDGDTDTLRFTITVTADLTPSFGVGQPALRWTQNTAITPVTLPVATGGDGTLTYALTPALPNGVTFNAASRRLSGTPTVSAAQRQYTLTVRDADGDTDTLQFNITVAADGMPSFSGTQAALSWTQNTAITVVTLPAATGGDGTTTYSLTPNLPSGVTFTAAIRRLSGTPTVSASQRLYTLTARDGDGDTDTLQFNITVAADEMPSFSGTQPALSWTQNTAITPVILPAASGGDGTLTYSLTPNLPRGVTFNAGSRQLSGTPTVSASQRQYTLTARDTDGDTDTLRFTITVSADLTPSFGVGQPALRWTQNTAITPVTLPVATGGDGTLTYALSPNLPSGVTFNAASRRLSGTPTVSAARTQYTLTARDDDGDTDTLQFNITVAADLTPSFGGLTQVDLIWRQNTAITPVILPEATGGDGTLTYSLSPNLPSGVIFTAATRQLSGTPTVSAAQRQYTLTARDVDGDTDTLQFNITVAADGVPAFTNGGQAALRWTQNTAIIAVILPAATGGDGTLTYALTPALPNGVTFNAATRRLSGTPTVSAPQRQYTLTASDDDGDTARVQFNITVAADLTPSFSGTQTALSWTQNAAITAVILPAATGGDGTLTYALTPALPNGVTFNAATRRLSGTPTVSAPQRQYTLTASDDDGDTARVQFNITVAADLTPSFSGTQPALSWTQNAAITAVILPAATGGDGTLTYALTPNLPSGVTFNAASRQLSGTPTVSAAQTQYTLTVRDTDGDTDTLQFNITVAADEMPSFSGTQPALSWTQNAAITPVTLPAASGGDGTLIYSLSPALPNGVTFNAASRQLSGTPTVSAAQTQYTLTVRDGDGDTDTLQFNITVAADEMPSFSGTQPALSWTQNTAITAVILPAASGGDGTLIYSLSPALPNGVTFNAASRQLSGTPTVSAAQTQYTLTARDGDGDTDTLQFNITVAADEMPSFSGTQPALSWTQNAAITPVTLPAATGGDGTLIYSLSPALPNGVTFNAASRQLSGTPTVSAAQTQYTLTARDTDGDADTLLFNITVTADEMPSFSGTQPALSWTQNAAITPVTLPVATGGDGTLIYSLSPALPNGVTFNAASRQLSGTPTVSAAQRQYTLTARDTDGDTDTLLFNITVAADLTPSPSQVESFVASTVPATNPVAISEQGGRASLTLTLDNPALADLSFPYTITGVSVADLASPDNLELPGALSGTITVPMGEAVGRDTIAAANDVLDEGTGETMTVTLGTLPTGITAATGIGTDRTQITITDDDGAAITITEINIYPNATAFTARRVNENSSPVGIEADRIAVEVVLSQRVQQDAVFAVRWRFQGGGNICAAFATGDAYQCDLNSRMALITDLEVSSGFSRGQVDVLLAAPGGTVPDIRAIRVCLPTVIANCRSGNRTTNATEDAISFAAGVGTGTADYRETGRVDITAAAAPAAVCSGLTLVRSGPNSTISFAASDVLDTLGLTLGGSSASSRTRSVVAGGYQVYQINVPAAGRLLAVIDGTTDGPGSDPEGILVPAGNCAGNVRFTSDFGAGSNLGNPDNAVYQASVSAGTYYVVAFDSLSTRSTDVRLVAGLFASAPINRENAENAVREQEARLLRQTRTLALDSTRRLTGMVGDLVSRRTRAPPDGISLRSLPDEGDMDDVRSLMRSSLSLQQSVTSESGRRWSLWASTASTGHDAVNAGLEWASDNDRSVSGIAISFASASLPFASGAAGLTDTDAWKWPVRWNEDMTIIAPYISRRSDSGEVWATAGFGDGAVHLGGGSAEARADSRLAFFQAGLTWGAVLDGGPRLDIKTRATAARRETSAYRLGIYQVPDSGVGVFRLDSETAASWPAALADGTLTPRMSLDLAYDAADLLPGHGRRSADVGAELHWSRGAFSTNIKTSRALSHDTDSRDVSAGVRWGLSHGLTMDIDTSRRVTDGIGDAPVHRARLSGQWAF